MTVLTQYGQKNRQLLLHFEFYSREIVLIHYILLADIKVGLFTI